jgi:tol-pal system protein YbgF
LTSRFILAIRIGGKNAGEIAVMRKSLILIVVMGLAVLSGCATRQQAIEIQMQLDAIRADQASIRAENARLDSLFRSNIETSRKLNADFANYITQLDQRMQMVEARLEDAITLMNRTVGNRPAPALIQPESSGIDTSKQAGGIDCRKLYNAAYGDFVQQRFDMAITGFKGYIESCPNTALNDNAQYWIGESYLSMKQYDKAQKAFEDMIEKYPASERIAAAKLKLGRSLYEQRQKTKARQYFEDVVKNYPGTEEAQEAAQMLQRYR